MKNKITLEKDFIHDLDNYKVVKYNKEKALLSVLNYARYCIRINADSHKASFNLTIADSHIYSTYPYEKKGSVSFLKFCETNDLSKA